MIGGASYFLSLKWMLVNTGAKLSGAFAHSTGVVRFCVFVEASALGSGDRGHCSHSLCPCGCVVFSVPWAQVG